MKRKILFILIGLISVAYTSNVAAQKIVFVDMAYILKNIPAYESANEQLTLISKRWQKEVESVMQEAQLLQSNYQTEMLFLSDEMKTKRTTEIVEKENEAMELKRKYFGPEGELFKKRESLIKPIQDEIYNAIQEVALEKRYDIVKDRSADPTLIYMGSKLDISDMVLQKLGYAK